MCYGAAGAGAAGYAAIAQAIKASGVIVHVEYNDFLTILSRTEAAGGDRAGGSIQETPPVPHKL